MPRREIPEGIRITKVGLWYVLFTLVVAVAATNTGNNALYITLAAMFGGLTVSGIASRQNVHGLTIDLAMPDEVYASQPFAIGFSLKSRGRLWPRWFLLFSVDGAGQPLLVPYLPRGGRSRGRLEVMVRRRGRHSFAFAHVASLFPFGFFRKGVRVRVDRDLLVFPELFSAEGMRTVENEAMGDDSARRAGRGHELHALRAFRQGDDPRGIHWKQTARTGAMVYTERESEQNRRLSIQFDNGVGALDDPFRRERFERLVSEAATAAVQHLGRGYEVELIARDGRIPFAGGFRQRLAVLTALALIQAVPAESEPLFGSDPRARSLAIRLEPEGAA